MARERPRVTESLFLHSLHHSYLFAAYLHSFLCFRLRIDCNRLALFRVTFNKMKSPNESTKNPILHTYSSVSWRQIFIGRYLAVVSFNSPVPLINLKGQLRAKNRSSLSHHVTPVSTLRHLVSFIFSLFSPQEVLPRVDSQYSSRVS